MKETGYSLLIDSSVWIDYFFTGNPKTKEYIDSKKQALFCSAISIHEVKKKLLREKYSDREISSAMDFMKNIAVVVDITEGICEKSALDAIEQKLHTADAIIYRTAIEKGAVVITLDSHFLGIKEAIVL